MIKGIYFFWFYLCFFIWVKQGIKEWTKENLWKADHITSIFTSSFTWCILEYLDPFVDILSGYEVCVLESYLQVARLQLGEV